MGLAWNLRSRLRGRERLLEDRIAQVKADYSAQRSKFPFESPEWEEVRLDFQQQLNLLTAEIERLRDEELRQEARRYDVEVPARNEDSEFYDDDFGFGLFLNPKGRTLLRREIDTEKTRRREVKTYWVTKIIIPAGGVLIGLLGAITGLMAVILHKK
jgi:hypothetical protein